MSEMDQHRIQSVLEAKTLAVDIENVGDFQLNCLQFDTSLKFELPTNLRLGHIIEKIVSHFISVSSNFEIVQENLQIVKEKRTLGEIDFIIFDKVQKQHTHVEVAYKFYLLDPTISPLQSHCWIGPNRRDSFIEKTNKLKEKQFPFLFHPATTNTLKNIDLSSIKQALCFMANLYLPISFQGKIEEQFQAAIKGYYVQYQTFLKDDHSNKRYHFPHKKEWGIAPQHHSEWTTFEAIQQYLEVSIKEQQAPLIWVKTEAGFEEMFVVWWD